MQGSLDTLSIDPQLLEALSSEELGAIVRLKIAAAKFGLPSEDSLLARLARVSDERWAQIKPMVQRAFAAGWKATSPAEVSLVDDADLQRRRAQTANATAARQAKRQAAASNDATNVPQRSKNVVSTLPTLISQSASPGSESALALQRSIPLDKNLSAQQGAPDLSPQEMGARARALAKAADHEWNRSILGTARFPWAAADRQIVPPQLIERLAIERHASPCRILFALQQIGAMGMKWTPGKGEPPNPLALLISALGAQLDEHKRTAPWDVPLGFIPVFDKAREHRDAIVAGQAMLDRARNRSRLSTSREEEGGSAFTEGTA